MTAEVLEGGFADVATDSARAFRAAMEAMARPGTLYTVTGGQGPAPLSPAASVLLLTLVDAETPLHLAGAHDREEVRAWLRFHTGAPLVERAEAMFALGTWEALVPLEDYAIGTPEYPDRSATLIVDGWDMEGTGATLSGPGIADTMRAALPDAAALRGNAALFPLGLDFCFTHGTRLGALPRSTRIG